MRLFTGISLPPGLVENIEDRVEKLRAHSPSGTRWSPAVNLHITTKFIGEWPESGLDELKQALGRVEGDGVIPIRIADLGFLPRVLFAGVDGGSKLRQLAENIDRALESLGCACESRAYKPHLTLARGADLNRAGRGDGKIQSLRTHIQSIPAAEFGTFDATEFHLYLSKPGPKGSVYTILTSWNLAC